MRCIMPGVKTAISIDEKIFKRVNTLAKEMHISRSHLFTLAVTDFLIKQENQSILAQLNKAYSDTPTDEEVKVTKSMQFKHGEIIEQESW